MHADAPKSDPAIYLSGGPGRRFRGPEVSHHPVPERGPLPTVRNPYGGRLFLRYQGDAYATLARRARSVAAAVRALVRNSVRRDVPRARAARRAPLHGDPDRAPAHRRLGGPPDRRAPPAALQRLWPARSRDSGVPQHGPHADGRRLRGRGCGGRRSGGLRVARGHGTAGSFRGVPSGPDGVRGYLRRLLVGRHVRHGALCGHLPNLLPLTIRLRREPLTEPRGSRSGMDYDALLKELYGLERFGIKLGLDTITELLGHMGNPHRRFQTRHVTGAKGKGSAGAVIASVPPKAGG